jgi:hypothetical protein
LRDTDNALYTPDSQEVKVYDSAGALKTTITDLVLVSTGVYYIKYTVPGAGPTGQWKISWKTVKGTDVGIEDFYFQVYPV